MTLLRRLLLLACVVLFLIDVSRFYSPRSGFSSLVQIGDKMNASKGIEPTPHHVYEDSWGYDGQAYVQLALHPTLDNPVLKESVDNLPYRARRIGMPWLSWLLGFGQPYWVLQAYSLLNVAAWLAIGAMLLHWLPPISWGNLLRWSGFMFSIGLTNSVHYALTDGPALAFLLLGFYLMDTGRARGALGAFAGSILCRETMLLGAGAALADYPVRNARGVLKFLGRFILCLLPFAIWMLILPRLTQGTVSQDASNFALPFSGYFGRWHELISEYLRRGEIPNFLATSLLSQLALTVQLAFFLLRWRPSNLWWRLGISSCVLLLFLGKAVWEGHPGAALRVLLPMSLAFNLLVPRGRRWLPILIVGNLGIFAGWNELGNTPAQDVNWSGPRPQLNQVTMQFGEGFYKPERSRLEIWCWSQEKGALTLSNKGPGPVSVSLSGRLTVTSPQRILIKLGEMGQWDSGQLIGRNNPFETPSFLLPEGRTVIRFECDQPGITGLNGDPRNRAFSVRDLTINVKPAN